MYSDWCTTNTFETVLGTFLGIGLTTTIRCCRTDLCNNGTSVQLDLCNNGTSVQLDLSNGGTSVQLSLAAACAAVLASLWAR
ncbi:unnamed protein product [Boreogadus saida]